MPTALRETCSRTFRRSIPLAGCASSLILVLSCQDGRTTTPCTDLEVTFLEGGDALELPGTTLTPLEVDELSESDKTSVTDAVRGYLDELNDRIDVGGDLLCPMEVSFVAKIDSDALDGEAAGIYSQPKTIYVELTNDGGSPAAGFSKSTLYHETGHMLNDRLSPTTQAEYDDIFNDKDQSASVDFVSSYAKTDSMEDFAETFEAYSSADTLLFLNAQARESAAFAASLEFMLREFPRREDDSFISGTAQLQAVADDSWFTGEYCEYGAGGYSDPVLLPSFHLATVSHSDEADVHTVFAHDASGGTQSAGAQAFALNPGYEPLGFKVEDQALLAVVRETYAAFEATGERAIYVQSVSPSGAATLCASEEGLARGWSGTAEIEGIFAIEGNGSFYMAAELEGASPQLYSGRCDGSELVLEALAPMDDVTEGATQTSQFVVSYNSADSRIDWVDVESGTILERATPENIDLGKPIPLPGGRVLYFAGENPHPASVLVIFEASTGSFYDVAASEEDLDAASALFGYGSASDQKVVIDDATYWLTWASVDDQLCYTLRDVSIAVDFDQD